MSINNYFKIMQDKTNSKAASVTIKSEPKIAEDTPSQVQVNESSLLWVDKYKPVSIAKIIGQQGDKSNAKKLQYWLQNWNKFHGSDATPQTNKGGWNRDDGLNFKAALLSGGPGIGKTTTATIVCKELGFTFIELNASDSRSKKLLESTVGSCADNHSIEWYQTKHEANLKTDKHCIIMDEVDGMAGNEDRGGVQELINLIKKSKVPIICICNDRQHQKIRSLANHCFDLRFAKPRIEQIRSALLSICFKEGIKITSDTLDQIIIGANHDIRQCIHNLCIWSATNKNFDKQKTQIDVEKAIKDVRINPFEACRQLFSHEKNSQSLSDRMDLFFTDYSLMPLLVHENYLQANPSGLKNKNTSHYLNLINESIDAICMGDFISKRIRNTNSCWNLLPVQAIFSCVVPSIKLNGSVGFPNFPSWLGKNSKTRRIDRILQELEKHVRTKLSANKEGLNLDYLPMIKERLTKPLIKNGAQAVDKVIDFMDEYYLTRDDFDSIIELTTWPGQADVMSKIDSKIKAAFTRTYNKRTHKNPFVAIDFKKLKGKVQDEGELLEGEDGEVNDEAEEDKDDIEKDAMIKAVRKNQNKAAVSTTKKTAATKPSATKRSAAAGETKAPASKKKKT